MIVEAAIIAAALLLAAGRIGRAIRRGARCVASELHRAATLTVGDVAQTPAEAAQPWTVPAPDTVRTRPEPGGGATAVVRLDGRRAPK